MSVMSGCGASHGAQVWRPVLCTLGSAPCVLFWEAGAVDWGSFPWRTGLGALCSALWEVLLVCCFGKLEQ